MLIESVTLTNIKSYRSASISFQRGTNAISGENGAGKSTILEAIGYALFDFKPYKIENIIRHGEKKGEIRVEFIGEDERKYEAVRSIRRKGGTASYFLHDFVGGAKLADAKVDGKDGVLRAIREHLPGIGPGADLPTLFQDVIGVPQGTIIAPFLETPANRVAKFDPILGIDEYKQARDRAGDVLKVIESNCQRLEKETAALGGKLDAYPGVVKELGTVSEEMKALDATIIGMRKEFTSVQKRKSKLEAIERKIQKITTAMGKLNERLKAIGIREKDVTESLRTAEKALKIVRESEGHYQSFVALEKERSELEQKRKKRDTLKRDEQEHLRKETALMTTLDHLDAEVTRSDQELTKLDELERKTTIQKDLEKKRQGIEAQLMERKERSRRLEKVKQERTRTASTLAKIRDQLAGLKDLEERFSKLDGLREELKILETKGTELKTRLKHIRESRENLGDGTCPFFQEPCPKITGTPSELFLEEESGAKSELNLIRGKAGELSGLIRESGKAGEEIQKMQVLVGRVSSLEETIAGMDREIKELEVQISGGPDESAILKVKKELTDLGDHRGEFQRVVGIRDQRPKLEKERDDLKASLERSKLVTKALADKLKAYSELETDSERIERERNEHRKGFEAYQKNKQESGKVEHLTDLIKEINETKTGIEADIKGTRKTHLELTDSFDGAEFADVMKRHDSLNRDLGSLEGKKLSLISRHDQLLKEKERLEGVQKEQVDVKQRLGVERFSNDLMRHIREVFKKTPDFLRKRYVDAISQDANNRFHELMGDNSIDLTWDETYGISMRKGKDTIDFQLLSGGQQMSAALAVRLALIRRFSGLNIAFFDEPTHNLDDERRDNLARAFYRITGFDQLFVISHDETFNTVIENTISIRMKDGESVVVG